MIKLTRQEQYIVGFIMLALIVGALVRLYRYSRQNSAPSIHSTPTSQIPTRSIFHAKDTA